VTIGQQGAAWRGQRGVALLIALVAMSLISILGAALLLSASVDRLSATNYDEALSLANFAESSLELAMRDLSRAPDWTVALDGTMPSSLTDGPPSGPRQPLPGLTIDLTALTNTLTCGRLTSCPDAAIRAPTAERPWGANNPRWRPFLYGLLRSQTPRVETAAYVVVWLGDDGSETDGDPVVDGGGPAGEGRYMMRARAEAFGPWGARRAIEAEVARSCAADGTCVPGIRVQSWRALTGAVP
jgi:type II secretory pathway pseudopilin PulG